MTRDQCNRCDNRGWLWWRIEGGIAVRRCELCRKWKTDRMAQQVAEVNLGDWHPTGQVDERDPRAKERTLYA